MNNSCDLLNSDLLEGFSGITGSTARLQSPLNIVRRIASNRANATQTYAQNVAADRQTPIAVSNTGSGAQCIGSDQCISSASQGTNAIPVNQTVPASAPTSVIVNQVSESVPQGGFGQTLEGYKKSTEQSATNADKKADNTEGASAETKKIFGLKPKTFWGLGIIAVIIGVYAYKKRNK